MFHKILIFLWANNNLYAIHLKIVAIKKNKEKTISSAYGGEYNRKQRNQPTPISLP